MSKLFSPLTIKDITFKNRIAVSPMCMYTAIDGYANDWHLVHYGSRATGGAGLIIQEATAVSPEGRISPGDLGLYNDAHIEMLQRITSFVKQQGAIIGIQLAHAGRKASCARPWEGGKQLKNENDGWTTIAPSPLPFYPDDNAPVMMNLEGIKRIVNSFKDAAQRALKAGYQLIDIHAAHGYLIHQFLSPISNHRTDIYGGGFENRIRLLIEIVDAIKSIWPSNLPLFVRLSATDWAEGGWNVNDSANLATILKTKGVDLIDTSAGGMIHNPQVTPSPGFMVPYAEQIKREAGILTSAVGLITQAKQAEEILQNGKADLVFMARESLRNPYFTLHAAKELGVEIDWPKQYLRAK